LVDMANIHRMTSTHRQPLRPSRHRQIRPSRRQLRHRRRDAACVIG
jgi:hypothetical protein